MLEKRKRGKTVVRGTPKRKLRGTQTKNIQSQSISRPEPERKIRSVVQNQRDRPEPNRFEAQPILSDAMCVFIGLRKSSTPPNRQRNILTGNSKQKLAILLGN